MNRRLSTPAPAPRSSGVVGGLAVAIWFMVASLGVNQLAAHPGLRRDVERLSAAIAADPRNAGLYAERAHYQRLGEHLEESLADLERGRSLEPDNQAIAVGLGLTLSALGRDAEAEAELNRFIAAGGRSVPGFAERAAIRARAGRFAEAIEDYTAAISMKKDVELYLERGKLQEGIGDLDAAARGYRDGFEKLGAAVTLRLALVRVETRRGEFDAALSYLDEELERAQVRTTWHLRRAEVLRAAGRDAEAEAALANALEEANRVIETRATGIHLFSRAQVYVAMGRTEQARRDLEHVLIKTPRFSQARELMGQLDAPATTQED